ncbi:MAG TPA: DUF3108 domain-containing protein [Thermoanaerobaculia bacterium]|nr:DUF3108 domain-containing protein [Thermoanaerobaculia bacterium]
MLKIRFAAFTLALMVAGAPAWATDLNCKGAAGNVEEFRYSWRLRGGLSWIAGLLVPTSGSGHLRTVFPATDSAHISSELLITSPKGKSEGFFHYESEMDNTGDKTLMSMSAYAWGNKAREERATFDYAKGTSRVRKETTEKVENKTRQLPDAHLRDVLTAIYFLRQNAHRISTPMLTEIYSDGKEYPVIFRPAGTASFKIEGRRVNARAFEIVDAPGGKKWPGEVKVYISDDARRIPFRIDITRSFAALQLDLKSIEACGFMQASR